MSENLSKKYHEDLKKIIYKKMVNFKSEAKKGVCNLLLSKALVRHQQYLPRFVVQSEHNECPPPFGTEYYRYVLPEIGVINGKRLFFEMINKEMPSINLHQEKKGKITIPPTIIYCEQTEVLTEKIIKLLENLPLNQRDELIKVPSGFYVFEFMAQERCWAGGSERKPAIVTVEPFQAKDLKKAIQIFMQWPQGSWYKDLSRFRVCTDTGWIELKSSLKKYVFQQYATLRDYKVSPKE